MLNFIGIGAQKAASTWLFSILSEHPKIKFPGGKEVHFWDQNNFDRLDWYQSIFSNDSWINGEITPAYSHINIEAINKIYSTYPDLKIIYILRNPIDRAWSSAKMALSRAELMIHEASDQWFIDHFKSSGSIARSAYEQNIKSWLNFFSKEQILLLRYENVYQNPVALLNHVLNHLGLPDYYHSSHNFLYSKIHEGMPNLITPLLKEFLIDMYSSDIKVLGDYLEEDFSLWLK